MLYHVYIEKNYEVITMNRKNIAATLAVMTALSSFSFAAETVNQTQIPAKTMRKSISAEDKKLYEQIYSKYEDKFNKLDVSLLENRQELQKQLRVEKTDWKKVETLTKKKADLKAQKELLGYQMNSELKSNNLRPMHPGGKGQHNRGNRQAPPRG